MFFHLDLYRIDNPDAALAFGIDEFLYASDAISLVEWPERCPDAVPEDCLRIRITADGENTRHIEAESCGGFRMISLE